MSSYWVQKNGSRNLTASAQTTTIYIYSTNVSCMAPTKSTKTVVNKALDVDIESTPENEEAQSMFVAVRIRPLSEKEKSSGQSSCCQVIDGKVVCIQKGAIAGSYLKSQAGAYVILTACIVAVFNRF